MNTYNFRKNYCIIPVVIIGILFFSPYLQLKAQDPVQQNQLKFGRLLRLVNSYYVDTSDVNKLTEKAIVHLLSELDPHSVYISKEEVDKMNEPLQGNFEGIGISFNIFKDTLLIISTIPGGPSEKTGMRAGDRIVEVDGKNIAGTGIKNSDVLEMLRGEKGTTVEVKVLRRNVKELLDFTIVRDKIPIYSLDAAYMLNKTTGYIKLNKFSATTVDEFITAMNELQTQKIQNLILDLRGNGGGYLKSAIDISDQFLKDDKMVVYTNGINDSRKEYNATSSGIFKEGNLVVLINESSASASEIVAGAIQDWDRGLVLGRRSFGKGLVQKPYFLTDGSMVRLTTAHYYTPSGRCIQRPYEEGVEDERTVFGGGGIMPDIFAPMDTSSHFRYYNQLRRNQIIHNFVLNYVDKNREKLKKQYPTFDEFNTKFEVTPKMVNKIVANGEKEGFAKNEKSLKFTESQMKREVKALIARDIFSRNNFFKILNQDDDIIKKALEVIKNQERYNKLLVVADE